MDRNLGKRGERRGASRGNQPNLNHLGQRFAGLGFVPSSEYRRSRNVRGNSERNVRGTQIWQRKKYPRNRTFDRSLQHPDNPNPNDIPSSSGVTNFSQGPTETVMGAGLSEVDALRYTEMEYAPFLRCLGQKSVKPDASDLHLYDLKTIQFFYNLGIDTFIKGQLVLNRKIIGPPTSATQQPTTEYSEEPERENLDQERFPDALFDGQQRPGEGWSHHFDDSEKANTQPPGANSLQFNLDENQQNVFLCYGGDHEPPASESSPHHLSENQPRAAESFLFNFHQNPVFEDHQPPIAEISPRHFSDNQLPEAATSLPYSAPNSGIENEGRARQMDNLPLYQFVNAELEPEQPPRSTMITLNSVPVVRCPVYTMPTPLPYKNQE